jgi:hypothetical protein
MNTCKKERDNKKPQKSHLLQEVRQGCTMVKMETAQTKVANVYSSNSKNGKWDIE